MNSFEFPFDFKNTEHNQEWENENNTFSLLSPGAGPRQFPLSWGISLIIEKKINVHNPNILISKEKNLKIVNKIVLGWVRSCGRSGNKGRQTIFFGGSKQTDNLHSW